MSLYEGARTRVRVCSASSEEFVFEVGMYNGCVVSLILLAVVVDVALYWHEPVR